MAARLLRALSAVSAVRGGANRGYAKKVGVKPKGKSAPKEPPKGPELVTDPATLANFAVGVNYLQDAPMVPLRPDAEYPEWLFQMHLGPPKKLQELDPDALQYWRRLRKHNSWQRNKLKKSRRL